MLGVILKRLRLCVSAALAWVLLWSMVSSTWAAKEKPLTFVVMDPLSKELACACVKGYGQRDYRKLTAYLAQELKRDIAIEFSDDLTETLKAIGADHELVVVGEYSRMLKEAGVARLKIRPLCGLSDPEGDTNIHAVLVAQSKDSVQNLQGITGRKILFALADTEANHKTLQNCLSTVGLTQTPTLEKRSQYTDAALDVLDSTEPNPPVALVPSYAMRLLQGCGSIKPGELKVIGKTDSFPFITLFVNERLDQTMEAKLEQALLSVGKDAKLLELMESKDGFQSVKKAKVDQPQASKAGDWPDWRGVKRDGHVPSLPATLPSSLKVLWSKATMPNSLAGLSVSGERVLVAERDFGDEADVYRCLSASTGELLWRKEFPTRGSLDYGQSPRATPVIHGERAYLLGAFGELRCVRLQDGSVLWKKDLPAEFAAQLPPWGLCATPLIVDDLIVVNPGAKEASLVALELHSGKTVWTAPGGAAAYSAFICGEFGGKRQIVGYDQHSLGGWDIKTGRRLWQLVPKSPGDFNVPTPMAHDGGLLVATENNGTRFYRFKQGGEIIPVPVASSDDLAPDSASPVIARGRVFGAHHGLHALDIAGGLKSAWHKADEAPGDYATMLTDGERVLLITLAGELVLIDAGSTDGRIISRLRVFTDNVEVYSHAALVDSKLFIRGGSSLFCVDLASN